MKSDGIGKHILFAFIIALILYLGSFRFIEHARQKKGPWQVTFKSDATGHPSVTASHEQLKISNVRFVFPEVETGQSNFLATVVFDSPITNIPFGKVIFLDTTFLPGTITMDLFGHEIELLPRVLVLDKKEIPWKSESVFQLFEKKQRPGPNRH